MSAHRVRRTVGGTVLLLLAPLLVLAAPGPASAVHVTTPMTVDATTTQLGRMSRNGVASTCGAQKVYPGAQNTATTYNVATTTFVAPTSGCLTVTQSNVTCPSGATNLFFSIYFGDYHHGQQDAHYVGDEGASAADATMSVNVEKGKTYLLVANNTTVQETCTLDVNFDLADDTTPPNTVFLRTPPTKVRTASVLLAFTGQPADDTAALQCRVDGAAFATCTSPLELDGLTVGTHTVRVRAVDEFGNADPTPATATFTSCDLAAAELSSEAAEAALAKADRAVVKAKAAVAKAHTPKAKKLARKKLAKAVRKAAKAKRHLATIRRGIHACAT